VLTGLTSAETTEEHYKNIKVLTGHPAEDLVPTMQFVSAALGVDCDFCHVERAPEKDDKKEKQTARKMMTMTLAINRESFEGRREVTCVTCHRGSTRPQAIPAIGLASAAAAAPAAPPSTASASADPILEKYLKASGGAEALAKIATRSQKGKLTGFAPEPFPVEVFGKAPDKRISIVHAPRGDSITAFDGQSGWLSGGGRGAREMGASEREAARLDALLQFPRDLKTLFKEFRVAPSEPIDGRDATHLIARNEGRPPAELWFDAQSGLLLRQLRFAETILGRNPTRVDYADYRAVDGVMVPFRWTVARPGGSFTIQIDETQHNVPIDDSRFAKPAPPPSEAPPPGEGKKG